MAERRWQPPPMNAPAADAAKRVTVDEQVVRKMLKVNPSLRQGRTTIQVKKALERGEPVGTQAPTSATGSTSSAGPAQEFADALGFFLRTKGESLQQRLAAIDAQRRALEAEAEQAKAQLRGQLISFVSLLDERAVSLHGLAALGKHAAFLDELGLSPAMLLDTARKGRA